MEISWYGILVALGFLAAYGVWLFFASRGGVGEHIDRVLLWALIPAVIGARLLFVLYHLDYFFGHPLEIPAVWHGGWVWHGALLGGLGGLWLYCRHVGIALLSLLDLLVPGVALGQAIGRWGNYVNQEAYGLPTDLPWALTIDPERRLAGYEFFATFHPTFLYESAVDLVLFLFLAALLLKYRDPSAMPRDDTKGVVFFLYLFLYSAVRFLIEFLRIDTVPAMLGLRAPQWISLGLMIAGIWGLVQVLRKQKKVIY